MKTIVWGLFYLASSILLMSCGGGSSSDKAPAVTPNTVSFGNPTEVTIVGYAGDAMEPSISRDGLVLFFNNLNSDQLPGGMTNDTNIHYAIRNTDDNFQYMGEVVGANTDNSAQSNELEGVPSIDVNNTFYFIRTIDYFDVASADYLRSIFRADYVNGTLTNLASLPNLRDDRAASNAVPGELNFDAAIHHDGDTLYFVQGIFSGNSFPDAADIGVARQIGGVFTANSNSAVEMALINTDALEYAPSISRDQLELYFTRATGSLASGFDFGVYVATRNAVADTWSAVKRIDAITGDFTEGPSISSDGELLYYHQKINGQYRLWVARRD